MERTLGSWRTPGTSQPPRSLPIVTLLTTNFPNAIARQADRKACAQQVNDGDREQFLDDCESGIYDGVLAISRTYDSVNVRYAESQPAASCTAAI